MDDKSQQAQKPNEMIAWQPTTVPPPGQIQRLVEWNKQLRRPMYDALSSKRLNVEDMLLLPFLYLAAKSLRTHQSILQLADHGAGLDAILLSRSMFEVTISVMWISKDPVPRLQAFMEHGANVMKKFQDMVARYPDLETPEILVQLEKQKPHVDRLASDVQSRTGSTAWNWSGKSLRQMAIDLDYQRHYDFIYGLTSEVEHSSVASLPFYVTHGDDGFKANMGKSPSWVASALELAYRDLYFTFEIADTFLELGLEEHLSSTNPRLSQLSGQQ